MRAILHAEFRDFIALIALVGTFGISLINLLLNGTADIPDWTIAVTTAVMAFYFGERRGTASAVQALAENGRLDRRENDHAR